MRRLTLFFIAAVAIPGSSLAATCGDWIPQTNGTSWRYCTDAQTGSRYCEIKRGSSVRRMACP